MKLTNRITVLIICLFIVVVPLLSTTTDFSYAENNPNPQDGWVQVNTPAETSAAVKAYLKARNFFTYADPIDAGIYWQYQFLDKFLPELGISMEDFQSGIQAHLTNGVIDKWFFSKIELDYLNQLYLHALQKYGIVPQERKQVWSGEVFEDLDNNKCLVWYLNSTGLQNYSDWSNIVSKEGSIYHYSGTQLYFSNNSSITLNCTTNIQNRIFGIKEWTNVNDDTNKFTVVYNTNTANNPSNYVYSYERYQEGGIIVYKLTSNNYYYVGTYLVWTTKSNRKYVIFQPLNNMNLFNDANTHSGSASAYRGTDNNPFESDKGAEVENNDDDTTPVVVPTDTPTTGPQQEPVPPDSVTPNPNNPTINPGNPDFNFQMPDINIDWELDLSDLPFPFSIPNDIGNFFTILQSEPTAPHIQETMSFGAFEYEIDIDLEQFDDIASYIRLFVLLSYIIGLIIATRALFHIY